MSKVTSGADFTSKLSVEEFQRYASRLLTDLASAFNGKIDFDINISSQTVTATFLSANTDLSISHNLKRTGIKYFAVQKSVTCDIYDGLGSTIDKIVLRSTAPASVTLVLF